MDPASIIGLTAAIQQLLGCVLKYGKDIHDAKKEINQFCSELLALKAALEHVQLSLGFDSLNQSFDQLGISNQVPSALWTPNLTTPEFKDMLASTNDILKEMLAELQTKPGRLHTSLQRLKWPWTKEKIKHYIDRLERCKGWLVLATTSDNMYVAPIDLFACWQLTL